MKMNILILNILNFEVQGTFEVFFSTANRFSRICTTTEILMKQY
jgi:hypothetical protein